LGDLSNNPNLDAPFAHLHGPPAPYDHGSLLRAELADVLVTQGEGRCPVRDDRTTRPILLADASHVPRMSSMRRRLCAMTWIAWTRPVRIACTAHGAHCCDVT
jgi:hypothetical protein